MKRFFVLLLAAGTLPLAHAQSSSNGPAEPTPEVINVQPNGPAQPLSQNVQMRSDGRCMDARPGDTVHYALTIKAVANAKAVYADLQLRPGGHARLDTSGELPPLDYRSLGGGGAGVRDAQEPTLYHFAFRVPSEIFGGVYRGIGVLVTTDQAASAADATRVDVTRRTRDAVAHYCLNVFSSFGMKQRPEVTNFSPGRVEPKH